MEIKIKLNFRFKEFIESLKEKISEYRKKHAQKQRLKLMNRWSSMLERELETPDIPPTLLNVKFQKEGHWYRVLHNLSHYELGVISPLGYDDIDSLAVLNALLSTRAMYFDRKSKKLVVYTESSIKYFEVVEVSVDGNNSVLAIKTAFSTVSFAFKHLSDLLPYIAEQLMIWSNR